MLLHSQVRWSFGKHTLVADMSSAARQLVLTQRRGMPLGNRRDPALVNPAGPQLAGF